MGRRKVVGCLAWLVRLGAAFLFFSCSSGPEVVPVRDVAFCSADAEAVNGRLYDLKQSDAFGGGKNSVTVFGRLILEGLRGWTTSEPVPSYSYWRNSGAGVAFELDPSVSFFGYWTGKEGALCEIPVWVIMQNFENGAPDLDKFQLAYRNPGLIDNVIIGHVIIGHGVVDHMIPGAEGDADKGCFKGVYDGAPLEILGVDIIARDGETEGVSIRHGVVVRSEVKRSETDETPLTTEKKEPTP